MVTTHKSGEIWNKQSRVRSQAVRRVCEALSKAYGYPRLGNPTDPIDDLVFIIISNKTSPSKANLIFESVKREFTTWENLLRSPTTTLYRILRPGGLANVKSVQIYSALLKIKQDSGTCNLQWLITKPSNEVQSYLVSLPGVSEKVAKCVMLYTMDIDVLPVDSHVHRICKRLGWTDRKRADQCHCELESLIPPKHRYAFHVDCIMHGRFVCRPKNPNCNICCLKRYCAYYLNNTEAY
jgi:endonuclease III